MTHSKSVAPNQLIVSAVLQNQTLADKLVWTWSFLLMEQVINQRNIIALQQILIYFTLFFNINSGTACTELHDKLTFMKIRNAVAV